MRSTVSIKTFILTLVIFFIGVSSFFYFFLYRPKINKVAKAAREAPSVEEIEEFKKIQRQVQEKMEELDRIRKEIERSNRDPLHRIPPELPREASSSES